MKQVLLALALVLSAYTSFAQQAPAAEDPCHEPVLELYNANRRKVPEGTMPRGKVVLIVRKNPACDQSIVFTVKGGRYYYAKGAKHLETVSFTGPVMDFTELSKKYQPGNRILFEIIDITYNYNKGEKTGQFSGGVVKNWLLN